MCFGPNGRLLVTAGWDSVVCFWDLTTGQRLGRWEVNAAPMSVNIVGLESLALSPNGALMAASNLEEVKIWNLRTGRIVRKFTAHTDCIKSVAFSPDGRTLATGSWDATAKLWDTATGREIRELRGHTFWIESVAFSPDGRLLATASLDGTAKLWEVATGREVASIKGVTETAGGGKDTEQLQCVGFSPDGRLLAVGGRNATTRLVDVESGKIVRIIEGVPYLARANTHRERARHTAMVKSVAFSPDSRLLATGSADNRVMFWDVATGRHVRTLGSKARGMISVAFGPSGLLFAAGGNALETWDVSTGRQLRVVTGEAAAQAAAFSPHTSLFAAARGGARDAEERGDRAYASNIEHRQAINIVTGSHYDFQPGQQPACDRSVVGQEGRVQRDPVGHSDRSEGANVEHRGAQDVVGHR